MRYGLDDGLRWHRIPFCIRSELCVRLYITREEKRRDGKTRALYDTGIFLLFPRFLFLFSFRLNEWKGEGKKRALNV